MITYFASRDECIFATQTSSHLAAADLKKLSWLFGEAVIIESGMLIGNFIGPRKEMITPWSTNAMEICQNMGVTGVERIEQLIPETLFSGIFDPMLQAKYTNPDQDVFKLNHQPEPLRYITDISDYNQSEGLALSIEEIKYLEDLSNRLGRKLTDSEIFGFSQVNSEHCRHKIFNGTFIIDGKTEEKTLFQLIKLTTEQNRNRVVSAYSDNCAFIEGPAVEQFSPASADKPDFFKLTRIDAVISLKAETHNFPTTVEPFNGAATGSGGEIRDRVAGGRGAMPLAGTAVYMTAYSRMGEDNPWENGIRPRKWLYQTPLQILIKASNGASDFGNKFGQPLTCGSLFTFEHEEDNRLWAYDKVIMLAGGTGYTNRKNSVKDKPLQNQKIVLLGGDNYRIGMGGGAVSSVATGEYGQQIELNAVQRSNPEMQKRICNAIRALAESEMNPIISIHDHGAGGHLNCFSELVDPAGGKIELDKLPVGDPTLSFREIIGNESQERIGLVLSEEDTLLLANIAQRERAPMYVVGQISGDSKFVIAAPDNTRPIDLPLADFFGNPPKTIMQDHFVPTEFFEPACNDNLIESYLDRVLQLEAVSCKDWLTNKVDRSVTGLVAKQQTCGELQLPLNNLSVSALGYTSFRGVASSIGHSPAAGLINPASGSVLAIAEALTNVVWAPIQGGLSGISLSANWMWPCRKPGEDARLYSAVKAASDFARDLGINIPTGKDSLSMTQKYKDGTEVYSPGTVIISATGEVIDFRKVVEPVLIPDDDSVLIYIDMSGMPGSLGGSSLMQSLSALGQSAPTVKSAAYFRNVFDTLQEMILNEYILAGHDISSGGLIVTLLEMCFANSRTGMDITLDAIAETNMVKLLFSENPGVVIQVKALNESEKLFIQRNIRATVIGTPNTTGRLVINKGEKTINLEVAHCRRTWFKTSYRFDSHQCGDVLSKKRFVHFDQNKLAYRFPAGFTGELSQYSLSKGRIGSTGIRAAIIREKGVNGDREMAYMLFLGGFDVKDVHMTDLMSGRETLEDVNLIVFVGGFSNSDVLGSARGWAGAFRYNDLARQALERYYQRTDTLSLGVCNGCQLMMELELVCPAHEQKPRMKQNASHKFESAFLNVDIPQNHSVMFGSLAGSRLGVWVAHGEGRFSLPYGKDAYHICMSFSQNDYPANPNGSDFNTAGICSEDGRHLAIMPHIERSTHPWNWAHYPGNRKMDEITPWLEAIVNAREWVKEIKSLSR